MVCLKKTKTSWWRLAIERKRKRRRQERLYAERVEQRYKAALKSIS